MSEIIVRREAPQACASCCPLKGPQHSNCRKIVNCRLHVIENKLFINKDGLFLIVSPPHTFERREAAGDFQQLLLPSYSNFYDSGLGTKLNSQ
jgi:hypothetical protein